MTTDRRPPDPAAAPNTSATATATATQADAAKSASVHRPAIVTRSLVSPPEYFTRGIEVTEVGDTQAADLLELFKPAPG